MSVRAQGYFSGGMWSLGYWTDSIYSERHVMFGRANLVATVGQPASRIINDLDDGSGGGAGVFKTTDALQAGGDIQSPADDDGAAQGNL